MARTVGIDVGGTKCLGVALDEHGDIVAEDRRSTPRGPGSLPKLIDTLAELAGELGPFDELGVGVPGLVTRSGVLRAAPNLDGVADFRDNCPMVPEDKDNWDDYDGCPEPDNDLDGIPDVNDECPNQPGERSRNGCPLNDRDNDGIADENDKCPDEPETRNEYLDEDGCPDVAPDLVKVTRTQVEIKEVIEFETGSATLLPASFRILDDVFRVLTDDPEMRLRIEGHTDSQGGDDFNLKLSNERANSVRVYLESKGVDRSRLTSVGLGETKPIDTNRTPDGRQRNRRVEFHIVRD